MVSSPVEQLVLAVVFVATFGYAVLSAIRSAPLRARIGYGLHAVMSVAMFTMVWPWGVGLFLVPQAVVFSAAAVWFVVLLARSTPRQDHDTTEGHHDGRRALGYHAVMMAAMVLMAAGMGAMGAGGGSGSASAMGPMPGPGMAGGSAEATTAPVWVAITSGAAAVGFAVAALYFLGRAVAGATAGDPAGLPARIRTGDAAWNLLMAAGMAALFIPMSGF